MVTVGMNYQIREGKTELFEKVFAKVAEVMDTWDGHVKTDLFTKVSDRHCYLILSEWKDRGMFDAFIASPQFRSVADWGSQEVLAARPTHQYYDSETN